MASGFKTKKSGIFILSSSVLEYKSENVNLNEYQIATEFDTRFYC